MSATIVQWPKPKLNDIDPMARSMWLRSQASYLAAEQLYRAVTLDRNAELVDLHPVERQQYIDDINAIVLKRMERK